MRVGTLLLEHSEGGAVNTTDASGRSALHWASLYGQAECVVLLLGGGALLDATDESGSTALVLAEGEPPWPFHEPSFHRPFP